MAPFRKTHLLGPGVHPPEACQQWPRCAHGLHTPLRAEDKEKSDGTGAETGEGGSEVCVEAMWPKDTDTHCALLTVVSDCLLLISGVLSRIRVFGVFPAPSHWCFFLGTPTVCTLDFLHLTSVHSHVFLSLSFSCVNAFSLLPSVSLFLHHHTFLSSCLILFCPQSFPALFPLSSVSQVLSDVRAFAPFLGPRPCSD